MAFQAPYSKRTCLLACLAIAIVIGSIWGIRQWNRGPENTDIDHAISALHPCPCHIHDSIIRSLRQINSREARPSNMELDRTLDALFADPGLFSTPDTVLADWLVSKGADPSRFPILANPCIRPEFVQWSLRHGAAPNMKNIRGQTPLHAVIDGGHSYGNKHEEAVLKLLLEAGADITARNKDGQTPLQYAIIMDSPSAVRLLLEHGATVKECNRTPGDLIVRSHFDIVATLYQHGLDPHWKDEHGLNALHHAASQGTTLKRINLLIQYGVDVNAVNQSGKTPLDNAARFRTSAPSIYQALLDARAVTASRLRQNASQPAGTPAT